MEATIAPAPVLADVYDFDAFQRGSLDEGKTFFDVDIGIDYNGRLRNSLPKDVNLKCYRFFVNIRLDDEGCVLKTWTDLP